MELMTGEEHLKNNNKELDRKLIEFWKWNSSDLLSNTLRGAFAEFIVSCALDIHYTTPHVDWDSFDILGKNGERIEVKSSAYLQSWFPENQPDKRSLIRFSIAPALEWMTEECRYKDEGSKRHSDVYVFCHYTCLERGADNPLEMNNWDFYVLATYKIDAIFDCQKSVTLESLKRKAKVEKCTYSEMPAAIDREYKDHLKHQTA